MKICIVTHQITMTDGQGRVNYEVARYLVERGHELLLVSTTIDPGLRDHPNVTWRQVKVPSRKVLAIIRYKFFALKANRILAAERPFLDVIHLNGAIANIRADLNACHFVHSHWLKSPHHTAHQTSGVYAAYQNFVTKYNADWERREYANSERIVAVSDFVRDGLVNEAGADPTKIDVIYNGVDTKQFHPKNQSDTNNLRTLLRIPDDKFLLFFSGGIKTNRKNLGLPLQSVAELGDRYHLVVVGTDGGGPYPEMARTLGISDRVHFLGHRNDVATLLRDADVFVFASHYDPFALVVTEAMASGVPVITAPSVGASAIIKHGLNGFVIEHSNDLTGMTNALALLAGDPALADRIRFAGQQTAEQLTWEAMAAKYESVYQRIVNEKSRQASSIQVSGVP